MTEILAEGRDHTDMLPLFRNLAVKSGAGKGDPLIRAGCEGPCYSMATFFSYGFEFSMDRPPVLKMSEGA